MQWWRGISCHSKSLLSFECPKWSCWQLYEINHDNPSSSQQAFAQGRALKVVAWIISMQARSRCSYHSSTGRCYFCGYCCWCWLGTAGSSVDKSANLLSAVGSHENWNASSWADLIGIGNFDGFYAQGLLRGRGSAGACKQRVALPIVRQCHRSSHSGTRSTSTVMKELVKAGANYQAINFANNQYIQHIGTLIEKANPTLAATLISRFIGTGVLHRVYQHRSFGDRSWSLRCWCWFCH